MSPWYVSRTGSTIAPCDERGWDRVEYHGITPERTPRKGFAKAKLWVTAYPLSRQEDAPREDHAPCYNRFPQGHAGVAELVDAPDSKSGGAKAPCRFEPDLRYS